MIKFFRRIRYNLMEKNQPAREDKAEQAGKAGRPAFAAGRYFKYAIGEIALVMIGILLALQVNNWNEDRAELKEQNKIIENLNLELSSNLENLNLTINLTETSISLTENLLLSMNGSTINKYHGEKLDSTLSIIRVSHWKRSDLNIKSIQSSGSLNNAKHNELKTLIYDWISQIESLEILEKKGDYAYQYYIDYIKKNGSWREIDKYMFAHVKGSQLLPSNDHLLMSPQFENCLNDLFIWETHKNIRYKEIKKRLIKLIEFTES